LLIDLKGNAKPDAVSRLVDGMKLTRINRLMTRLTFRFLLIKTAYTRQEFEQMLAQAGFSKTEIVEEEIGFEIRMTK
jgi:hypothetical protein